MPLIDLYAVFLFFYAAALHPTVIPDILLPVIPSIFFLSFRAKPRNLVETKRSAYSYRLAFFAKNINKLPK